MDDKDFEEYECSFCGCSNVDADGSHDESIMFYVCEYCGCEICSYCDVDVDIGMCEECYQDHDDDFEDYI